MTFQTRRAFLARLGAAVLAPSALAAGAPEKPKRHIVTLSFDDGFKKSFIHTAEIYEKFKLSACLNVIASGHMPDFKPPDQYIAAPRGDFGLWNELQERGHEIMPHGWRHENLRQTPPDEARELTRRCLDLFTEKLKGFDPHQAVYNFPFNDSTKPMEEWLATRVRAFRTGGGAINPFPHKGQVRLTCGAHGPDNCEKYIDEAIEKLLARQSGWLIFNTHGLDEEGWGPIRTSYLEKLLERLVGMESVDVLPAGRALKKYANSPALTS